MSKTVLLIDDEPDIREVAQLSLGAVAGWKVLTAGGGAEGVELAADRQPDAILLDVMMPDIDGPATFERLQSDPQTRDIPVILLTAKAHSSDRRGFEQLGVSGVLTKPFDPILLSAQVEAILAKGDGVS
jgi:two-component system alkaline phosphatase synthesis response regulator PhoP